MAYDLILCFLIFFWLKTINYVKNNIKILYESEVNKTNKKLSYDNQMTKK